MEGELEEQLRILVGVGLTGLLVLLRLDAFRFGTAEYDDESASGGWRGASRRLAWYGTGVALAVAIWYVFPTPVTTLHLGIGTDRTETLVLGLAFGGLGTLVAGLYAWLRYRRLRWPEYRHYPGAAANAIGTAFIDEACFRGAILGITLALGWPTDLAIAFQAVLYGITTRLGAPGRSRGMLLIALGTGVVAGFLTVWTGGIGASFVAHSMTRFATFVTTGHAGLVKPPGQEPEEAFAASQPPEGWEVVGEGDR